MKSFLKVREDCFQRNEKFVKLAIDPKWIKFPISISYWISKNEWMIINGPRELHESLIESYPVRVELAKILFSL